MSTTWFDCGRLEPMQWHRAAGKARRTATTIIAGALLGATLTAGAATPLANQPLFAATAVPGNLALALSTEFPTVVSVAHLGANNYTPAKSYLGYFDPEKCYTYKYTAGDDNSTYFEPAGLATSRICSAKWSGNFLNWATMHTIDPFRWALTGGYRFRDDIGLTVLEKATTNAQTGTGRFPNKSLAAADVAGATPFGWTGFNMRVHDLGVRMRFTNSGNAAPNTAVPAETPYDGVATDGTQVYSVKVRVKVCDPSAAAGGVESNCVRYSDANYKPEGLMQGNAMKLSYSAFGYLNDDSIQRDGGVLRARQKFIGPNQPNPGKPDASNTPRQEWDPATGIMEKNPESADAAATNALAFYNLTGGNAVVDSGVLNYLNKFGTVLGNTYKTYDPVSELYYAVVRYFKNQGDVAAWSAPAGDEAARRRLADGFPVIRNWDDPIKYSCQKNFVLGIGDNNTHADKNVAGYTGSGLQEPVIPGEVSGDLTVNAVTATNKVGDMQGIANLGSTFPYNGCCNNNSALMAGLAYHSHTVDMRPDDATKLNTKGKQTLSTYWLNVVEYFTDKANNQYYLAALYGGFDVPVGFDYTTNTAKPAESTWWTSGQSLPQVGKRPDNYFVASEPDTMVAGLVAAFAKISSELTAFTTSFSTSLPQVSTSGNASFSAQYDAKNWTGEVVASELSFDSDGNPSLNQKWKASETLAAQAAGTGWDTDRKIATWNGSTGVRFRLGSLNGTQQAALNTVYRAGDDRADYLNYLRGEPLHEKASAATGSAKAYRDRAGILIGDIVGSRAEPVAPPSMPFSDAFNPGYGTFKATNVLRETVLYVGSNNGMLHAFNGALTGTDAGKELFAYVPGSLFVGVDGTPQISGLAALGNPSYSHRFFVNATPKVFDVDFDRVGGTTTNTPDWRSVLIGGLGKGGKSYYAIDVTNPTSIGTEADLASKVLWEFNDPDLGHSFGDPIVVKTRQYGWTVVFGSGYNNANGKGFLFFVNPKTGALLQKVGTEIGSVANDAGLAHPNAHVLDRTDATADAIYVGDLLGNLWRVDVGALTGTYPAPVAIAAFTDSLGAAQPVTSKPLIETHPKTRERYVMVGTGRLLADADISSGQVQSFYAIIDGTSDLFTPAAALPPSVNFPIGRGNLVNNLNVVDGITRSPSTPMGWFADLGSSAAGIGWRVISDPQSYYGTVAFASTLPNGDACSPSGISRVYNVDFAAGDSKLVDAAKDVIPFIQTIEGVVTDVRFLSVGGKLRLIIGTDKGELSNPKLEELGTQGFKRLNWREVPTIE